MTMDDGTKKKKKKKIEIGETTFVDGRDVNS